MPVTLHLSLQRQEIAGQARDDVGEIMNQSKSSRPPSRDLLFPIDTTVLPMATPLALNKKEIAGHARDDRGRTMVIIL